MLMAFVGTTRVASGEPREVYAAVCAHQGTGRLAIYDENGRTVEREELESLARLPVPETAPAPVHGVGRPKLGVVAREVSLLPKHWEWLAQQRGGASASLRRLVEEHMKHEAGRHAARMAQEALHRMMWDMAGNWPGFEEACRCLFAHDYRGMSEHISTWPEDARAAFEERMKALEAMESAAAAEEKPPLPHA